MVLAPSDASRLRDYLLKGGFLWVDDFWGTWEWNQWVSQIAKVLPPSEYPIVDLPLQHPLFQTMFNIWEVPQNRQHRLLAPLGRRDLRAGRR